MSGAIRLLLADDQALVRGALAALLDLETDLEVVAEVGRGDEVVEAARRTRPDVALLDVEMPGLDGIAATADAAGGALPSCKVLVVTTFGRPGLPAPGDGGRRQRVRRQGHPGPPAGRRRTPGARRAAGRRPEPGRRDAWPAGDSPLTARESEVLRAARDGGTVADLAFELHLSEGTVRNYLSAAIGKTGARTRAEAVRLADERGWLLGG